MKTKQKVKIVIKEINTSGIDTSLSGFSMKRPLPGKRSKAKESDDRIEADLHNVQSTIERLEEYIRHMHKMIVQIINKNK
tara:strand:+ start:31329 stop:31568 length:240 start_codon:yes stop_codon:yes gene_type:complete